MPTLADLFRQQGDQDLASIPRPVIDNQLAALLRGGGNFIRNDQTGNVIDLGQSQAQPRFTGSPVDVFGQGKGYLDPSSGIIRGVNQAGQNFRVQPAGTEAARIKGQGKVPDWKDPAYLAYQRELLKFKAGLNPDTGQGKAPPGYRFTPNNDLELIPGGPADEKSKMKSQGSEDVDLAISALRDAYDRLEQGGGITSSEGGALGNIGASASSSALGQVAGKMLGTRNQSARNDIAMTRPALLAALMRATGMSAKQMDSNAELKLWLATATDPTLDVESNRRALNNIEIKYLGNKKKPVAPVQNDEWSDL